MFKKILYLIVIITLCFITIGLFLPPTVHVERSIEVARPPATVFTLLNGFGFFSAWSPWSERDPGTVYGYSGPVSGPGARMSWSGDPRLVGSGWQEIIESTPWAFIRLRIRHEQIGTASSRFQIDPESNGVLLTWAFEMNLAEGRGFFSALLFRYFGVFFNHWIGTHFESGLQRFKAFAESFPSTDFSDLDVALVEVAPATLLYVPVGRRESAEGVAASLATAFGEITELMAQQSIEMEAPPLAITRTRDGEALEFDAAIPIPDIDVELNGNVRKGPSPSGRAVRVVHRGGYDKLPASYAKLQAYMAASGLGEGPASWEQYVSNPAQTAPGEAVTLIYYLIEDPSREQD